MEEWLNNTLAGAKESLQTSYELESSEGVSAASLQSIAASLIAIAEMMKWKSEH